MNCHVNLVQNVILLSIIFPRVFTIVRRQDEPGSNYRRNDIPVPNPESLVHYQFHPVDNTLLDLSQDVVVWAHTWPQGIVYYEISPEFNESSVQLIHDAMKEISDKTCITYQIHTNQPDYIYFRKVFGDGCHTHAGRKGGKQILNLDPQRCIQHGKVMHELLHVLGFHHEHQRPDRDNYIDVYWDNIKPGDWSQMAIFDAKKSYLSQFGYDYSSILHYGNESFFLAIDRSKPILASKHLAPEMGQRKYLSELDTKKVNFLYNCDKHVK